MSALSDKIANATASADAAISRVQTDVAALQAKIDALTAAGGAAPTPEELASIDMLKAKLDALDPTNPAVLP